ncbi:MAG: hypothetical protein M1834_001712 [Cirrosporium novae-zelandiae]|nr:MAG: hypothetical protein M1834_001712 [Cirrosporium novae-zelandiae]
MAPALTETLPVRGTPKPKISDYKEAFNFGPSVYNADAERNGDGEFAPAKYPNYLPVWDATKVDPPLQPFEHYDHGKDADPTFPNLLTKDAVVNDLTGDIGAEVSGIQLSKLSDKGKDELALFVAQKKVVAFRNQDLADLPIQEAVNFGGYFGRHHTHVTSGSPKGFPEIHLVHRSAGDRSQAERYFKEHTNSITWHSDVSFELQPPGTTFLYLLEGPAAGGDTLFLNQVEAYNRLSPEFRKRLHGLKAVHSGFEQATTSQHHGGVVKRAPVANEHPIVRTHPVTGEKALFINPQFTRYIVGYKKEESDMLLNFLYQHMALSQDVQARVKWAPGTVAVWDNRVTAHSAILDWCDGQRRHLARLTPQAERPTESFDDKEFKEFNVVK